MRDDKWLFEKLDEVWDKYFGDVLQENDVRIVWGRRARTRLGSIKKGKNHNGHYHETIITINKLFQDKEIPEYVVLSTIAHEMAHYAHGFHSPLEQKFDTPHAGGIIHKEMEGRGLAGLEKKAKKWLKENWRGYIMDNYPPKPRKRRRVKLRWI